MNEDEVKEVLRARDEITPGMVVVEPRPGHKEELVSERTSSPSLYTTRRGLSSEFADWVLTNS